MLKFTYASNSTIMNKLIKRYIDIVVHHCKNLETIKIYNVTSSINFIEKYVGMNSYNEYFMFDYMLRQFAKYLPKLKVFKYFTNQRETPIIVEMTELTPMPVSNCGSTHELKNYVCKCLCTPYKKYSLPLPKLEDTVKVRQIKKSLDRYPFKVFFNRNVGYNWFSHLDLYRGFEK